MKSSTLLSSSTLLFTLFSTANSAPQENHTGQAPQENHTGQNTTVPSNTDPSWEQLTPNTIITTSKGNFTIKTRLTGFVGCEDKVDGEDRQGKIMEAFTDALKIVGSVGNPTYILGFDKDHPREKGQEVYDYWGQEANWQPKTVYWNWQVGNYRRAQLTGEHWRIGDWWHDRYFNITCNDPLQRCKNGLRAYQNDPDTPQNPYKYPRINLCDVGANSFFKATSLADKVKSVREGTSPSNNVESMRSRGSIMLHEMFHTKATSSGSDNNGGISQPKAIDVKPVDLKDEKAYGAARAKWLARRKTLEKSQLVFTNVDNYVYYALSTYMMKTLNVPYPTEPKAAWKPGTAIQGEEGQELVDDLGGNDLEVDVKTTDEELTDDELYKSRVPVSDLEVSPEE